MKRAFFSIVPASSLALLLAGCALGRTPVGRAGLGGVAVLVSAEAPSTGESDQAFRVAEVGPAGTVPHENLEGGAWVLFNKPVIALKRLEKPAASSPVMSISPRVEGAFRWYGSRLLSFEPRGPLAPATEYTVTVSPSLRSLAGEALTGERTFRFRTEPLTLVSVSPSGDDVPPEESRQILVTFNFPVDLKTIQPSIRLEAGGKPVGFTLSRPAVRDRRALGPYEDAERLVSLKPSAELPRDTDVKVRILPGAKPRPGTYGTEAELAAGFHTLTPLFFAQGWVDEGWTLPSVSLSFTHPLDESTVARNIRVEIPGYSLEQNMRVWESDIVLSRLPVAFESTLTVTVLGGLKDLYGQALGVEVPVTLEIGPAASYLWPRGTGQKLLEAAFPPVVALELQNVLVGRYGIGSLSSPFAKSPPAPTTAIDVAKIPANTRHFELFDLSPYLNDERKGAAFLSWDFRGRFWGEESVQETKDSLVVQVTDIGASVHVAYNRVLVHAASLSTGAPVSGAAVTLRKLAATVATGRTDAAGLASLAIPSGAMSRIFGGSEELAEVQIVKGKDRLVLRPFDMPSLSWNSQEPYSADEAAPVTYLWSDRGIYRPGETVSFAGFDRNLAEGKLSAVKGKFRVDLASDMEEAAPVASFTGTSSPEGGFSGQVALPKDLEPGDWFLVFSRTGPKGAERTGSAWVRVASFRRVTFSVDIAMSDARKIMGDTLEASFSGAYLAGGSVRKGKWTSFWTRRETWYQPPGDRLAGYSFGIVTRGWPEDLGYSTGSLSGTGVTVASQPLADGDKGRVYSYEVVATVEDVDRQAISQRDSRLVFSSAQLLGAKIVADSRAEDSLYFVRKGEPFTLKVLSVDADGKPFPSGDVAAALLREDWRLVRERGIGGVIETRYEPEEVVEKSFTLRPGEPFGSAQLATGKAGSYAVELSGRDAKGRESYTRLSFYSTGSDEVLWNSSDQRRIEIVPDRKSYAPGDTAHLLIKSPLAKGRYLVTVEREGIMEQRTVDLAGGAPTIDVEVKDAHVPVVYVSVSASLPRTSPPAEGPDAPDFGKPRGYSGVVELPVETAARSIRLQVSPSAGSYRPGTDASVTVRATRNGAPVPGAEVVLVAADRGVLDLIDYRIPDPAAFFYSRSLYPDRVAHYDSRDLLLDPVTWKMRDLPGGDEKAESAPAEGLGVQTRRDFNPTAVFRAGLVTGADGTVTVTFRLPDLETLFRATAVAARGDAFGIADGEILVQNPINARTALPRRLRVGDAATAGIVLTNLDAKSHSVTVEAAAELLSLSGARRKTVALAPGESSEVTFDLGAPAAGAAKITFTIESDILSERLEESLAVAPEYLSESVTIVGKTADKAEEAVVVPSAFLGAPGEGLHLSLDSTIASALAGAVRFLEIYPYDCLEQVTSKLFSRVLFPDPAGGEAADLGILSRFANADGGFSYWDDPQPRRSSYSVSLRVAHLLAAARGTGIQPPAGVDTGALIAYLAAGYDAQDPYLQSYALYVMAAHGRREKLRAEALAAKGDAVGVFGYGFLGLAFHAMGDAKAAESILERLKSFVRVGTRTVTLVGTVNDWFWYGGDIQAKALLLMLYARVSPDSQLVLGLANDLLASNKSGYWGNTSNAGWVLQAFAEIVARGGERDADFTARVSLGGSEIARAEFKGFSKAPYVAEIGAKELGDTAARLPGKEAAGGKILPLAFGLEGRGTLYYTAELRTAISPETAEPREEGIGIASEIIDEQGKPVEGTVLAPGRVYRMRIVLYTSRDRAFVAVRAPIPSGAEPLDGTLETSQVARSPRSEAEGEPGYPGYSTRIYDSEVRFFFDEMGRGKHEVGFSFRTTTPGTYPTPPVQAELMYQPEVFGRGAGAAYRIGR